MGRRLLPHACAIVGYAGLALLFNWPLPLQLSSATTGPITGDTGVYVWNIWLFRYEIVANGRFPLFTREILSLTPQVDLSLHNYTLFADLLAFPLIPFLGVTVTFNVVYLAIQVITAWTMFLLARAVIGRDAEAWLVGLLFAFSPVLIARSTGHFSLVAAAPLPLLVLFLMRAEQRGDLRYALAAGATVAWAATCDPYYAIFCLLIAGCYFATRRVRVWRDVSRPSRASFVTVLDVLLIGMAALIVGIARTGGGEFQLLDRTVAVRSLYTPVLLLTVLATARLWLTWRPRFELRLSRRSPMAAVRFAFVTVCACIVPLSPILYAFTYRLRDGGAVHGSIFWRSSPGGVDLLALFAPNPNHAWLGGPWRDWLTTRPGGFTENVASLTIVGVAVVAIAVWRYKFRPPRTWLALTIFFGTLALGPFVYVGGINTFVPTPWAILRYVPVITATRTPARYAVVLMMAFAILFGLALAHIASRHPKRRRFVLAVVGLVLAFELAPFPRRTYSASIPDIYQVIANDPRDVRVLELPTGIRDGELSEGNFNAATQYYQTFHQKRLIGGYLSRISTNQRRRHQDLPFVPRLIRSSEGRGMGADISNQELRRRATRFVRFARLGYVVVHSDRTTAMLRQLAIDTLQLVKVAESNGHELYVPTAKPVRRVQARSFR